MHVFKFIRFITSWWAASTGEIQLTHLVMDGKKDVFKAEVYLARPSSVPSRKTQVTIRLDDDLLDWFRNEVDKACGATIKRGLTWQYEITSD